MTRSRKKTWQILSVFLFFLLLGGAFNLPLIRHFASAIPYTRFPVPGYEMQRMNMGDHLNLYYNFWLLKDNVTHLRNPFSDPYQFYYWGKKFFNPQIGFFSFLFAPFSFLGDTVAFNLVFLLSFLLAGGCTFLWLRKAGLSFWPAMVGGTLYCLAPHRLSQMCGHINGLFYFSFPLLLYFAEGMARSFKKTYPVMMGGLLLVMAWTEYHMFYYTILFLVPYGLFLMERMVPQARDNNMGNPGKGQRGLLLLEGIGVGCLVATVAFLHGWPYGKFYFSLIPIVAAGFYLSISSLVRLLNGVVESDQGISPRAVVVSFLSPFYLLIFLPLKLLMPIPQFGHLLLSAVVLGFLYSGWKAWSRFRSCRLRGKELRQVFRRVWPIFPFVLGAAGVVVGIKALVLRGTIAARGRSMAEVRYFSPHFHNLLQRLNYQGETMVYLGILALVLMGACLWMLMVTRRAARHEETLIRQARFWFGAFLFVTFLALGFSVPYVPVYALFYKIVPYFKYPRVPGRLIFISYAAMAFCVAWVIERISVRKTGVRVVLACAVMAGLLWDYFPPRPIGLCLLDKGKTVYESMDRAGMPPKAELELPIWPGDSAWSTLYQYYVTRYRYPMVNGYSPVVAKDYVKKVFYGLYPMDVGEVSRDSLAMLKKLRVKYVTFHADAYPYKISPFPSWLALERLRILPFLSQVASSSRKTLFRVVPPVRLGPEIRARLEAITSPVGVLWEAERSRHLIGRVVADPMASAGKALATSKPVRGMMMGGQNRFFPAGWYEGVARVKPSKAMGPSKGTSPGSILITGRHRRALLAKRVITMKELKSGGYTDIRFTFHVPTAQKIECIVYSNGIIPLCLDYVFIAFRGRGEGPGVFQAENLFHLAPICPLPDGQGEGVRFSPDVLNDRGIGGPLHRLMPGHYRATFYMEVTGKVPDRTPMALIMVARGHQRQILAQRMVRFGDWALPGRLAPFSLDFSIRRPSIMQFPVYYQGRGVLWVDRVKVAKKPSP